MTYGGICEGHIGGDLGDGPLGFAAAFHCFIEIQIRLKLRNALNNNFVLYMPRNDPTAVKEDQGRTDISLSTSEKTIVACKLKTWIMFEMDK